MGGVLRRVWNRVCIAVDCRAFEANRVEACVSVCHRNQNVLQKPTKATKGTKRQTAEYAKHAQGKYRADAHARSIGRFDVVQLSKSRNLRSYTGYIHSICRGMQDKIASGCAKET